MFFYLLKILLIYFFRFSELVTIIAGYFLLDFFACTEFRGSNRSMGEGKNSQSCLIGRILTSYKSPNFREGNVIII